jgi:hypothetical protein
MCAIKLRIKHLFTPIKFTLVLFMKTFPIAAALNSQANSLRTWQGALSVSIALLYERPKLQFGLIRALHQYLLSRS